MVNNATDSLTPEIIQKSFKYCRIMPHGCIVPNEQLNERFHETLSCKEAGIVEQNEIEEDEEEKELVKGCFDDSIQSESDSEFEDEF